MYLLIDYDNIPPIIRARGVVAITEKLLGTIMRNFEASPNQCTLRFYGGWFEGETLTRKAQELSNDIDAHLPYAAKIPVDDTELLVRTNAELAKGILAFPRKDLSHTYRPRGWSGIKCFDRPFLGCSDDPNCRISAVHDFVSNRKCPSSSCDVHPKKVFFRAEQKLVDTMLACDITHLVALREQFVIVTSDDDLWPPILQSLATGNQIMHIHPKEGQSTPEAYLSDLPGSYYSARLPI